MPDGHSLLLFVAAGLALDVAPGPDMQRVTGVLFMALRVRLGCSAR